MSHRRVPLRCTLTNATSDSSNKVTTKSEWLVRLGVDTMPSKLHFPPPRIAYRVARR